LTETTLYTPRKGGASRVAVEIVASQARVRIRGEQAPQIT